MGILFRNGFLLVVLSLMLSEAVLASEARPQQLVCAHEVGLTSVLNALVHQDQFYHNDYRQSVTDAELRRAECEFTQIPVQSTGRVVDIFQTQPGFIFPLFAVTYSTTGQTSYTAFPPYVFSLRNWRVGQERECGNLAGFPMDRCLIPINCNTYDRYEAALSSVQSIPFVVTPRECQVHITF